MDSRDLFEILVRENEVALSAFIRTVIADRGVAEDVWQETMLVAWRRINDYDRSRPFGAWLRGIAAKIALAKRKSNSKWLIVEDQESIDYLSARFDQLHSLHGNTLDEKLDALRDCIARLPEKERQSIELRYRQEAKPSEMAVTLNTPIETIKKRLLRAKQRLLECIQFKMQEAQEKAAVPEPRSFPTWS